jgi:hypothetical protein
VTNKKSASLSDRVAFRELITLRCCALIEN